MASIKHLTKAHAVSAVLLSVVLGTVGCGLGQQKHHLKEFPSPDYMIDGVGYYKPGPEFKIAREKERLRKASQIAEREQLNPSPE